MMLVSLLILVGIVVFAYEEANETQHQFEYAEWDDIYITHYEYFPEEEGGLPHSGDYIYKYYPGDENFPNEHYTKEYIEMHGITNNYYLT